MLWLLLLSFCLVPCYGKYQDDDWIDPTDMLNYDAASGRMKHQKPYPTGTVSEKEDVKEPDQEICDKDHLDCKKDFENWRKNDQTEDGSKKEADEQSTDTTIQTFTEDVKNMKQESEKCGETEKIPPRTCNPIFRRYLHRIVNEAQQLGLPDESEPVIHYDAEIVLTNEMIREIQRFLKDADWNAGALDEALSRTLVRFKHHNEEDWRWNLEDYIGIDPFSAFMVSLSLFCIVMMVATELWTHIRWITQIKRLFVILFVISIGWNWLYLYQVAFAERQAELTKMEKYDETCGKKMSWSESLFEWWKSSATFQNDQCEEYFKSLMVNPILLVPPTKAFAVTFTNFITEPLKHIGKGIGEFFHALLAEMPVLYQLPVLIIIVLLLLVSCYGASTSIAHIGAFRRIPNAERERLPPPEHQRPEYLPSNQLQNVEGVRYVLLPKPDTLRAVDHTDHQSFIESPCACHQQQKKQDALEKSICEQYPRNDSHLKPETGHQQERSQGRSQVQQEETQRDSGQLSNTSSLSEDFHTERAVTPLPDTRPVSKSPEEVKLRKESSGGLDDSDSAKQQQPKQEEKPTDYMGFSAGAMTSLIQGSTVSSLESNLPDPNLTVEDLYTDPDIDEQSEAQSFIVLEKPETEADHEIELSY